ncbi:MAG: Chromate resistance protein ChrB [Micromonosporaceae bacterium]
MTTPRTWLLLIYRVPSTSSRARVAVWRELKRLGALYVQQAVCVFPDRPEIREALDRVRAKVSELEGSSLFFPLGDVGDDEQRQIEEGFRGNSAKEYAEIIEECETKFFKEIEFERFRENYTFEETEEIRQDLEKLRRWLARVEERDFLGAPGKDEAVAKITECEQLLEQFEADVYARVSRDEEGATW